MIDDLRAAGYEPRLPEEIALRAIAAQTSGARVLLCEGPPGCGKTALAQAYAQATRAAYLYALLHSWTDDQELFVGVDVAAAVAGDAARVHRSGIIALAAEASHRGHVVLCLDELDKAPDRVEGLLLDMLQTGRVPVRPGEQVQARLDRLTVIVTSNGQRQLGDAFLRRCRRVWMSPLPVDVLDRLVEERAGVPRGVARLASKAARAVAVAEGNPSLSLQEIAAFAADAWVVAQTIQELRELLAQHAARTAEGAATARRAGGEALWGEIAALRRRAAACLV